MTNDLFLIADIIGPATGYSILHEAISTGLAIAIPVLIAFWRRSAVNSKLKSTVIDALVRGIEKSTENMNNTDTAFVKEVVRNEAENAGVEKHVEKAVDKVTTQMAKEKTDAKPKTE